MKNLDKLFAATWVTVLILVITLAYQGQGETNPKGREIHSPIYRMDGHNGQVPTLDKLTKTTRDCTVFISFDEKFIRIVKGFGEELAYKAQKLGKYEYALYQRDIPAGSLNYLSGTGIWKVRQYKVETFYLLDETH